MAPKLSSTFSAASRPRLLAGAAALAIPSHLVAGDFLDTRYQYYAEDHGRVRVDSNYSLFGFDAGEVKVEGSFLYSLITGASPTGLPGGEDGRGGEVPVVDFEDERYAGTLGVSLPLENHTLKVGGSYSYEPDYLSKGLSLQDTISLNEKNTELTLGLAYSSDTVGAAGSSLSENKEVWDAVAGVSQLLGPKTVLRLNAGLTSKRGYLSDPYKRVAFDGFEGSFRENRPDSRTDLLLTGEISHYLEPLRANLELSLRYAHSDHGMDSGTLTASLTREFCDGRLTVKPTFRYYTQTQADYYDTRFRGNPDHYSSDYRVSELGTVTWGVQAHWRLVPDRLSLSLGYERYLMRGLDGKTSQDAYPDASALTVGLRLDF